MRLIGGVSMRGGERGAATILSAVFLMFLMLGFWSLMSATEQWNASREAHATATAAARAGAQGDPLAIRSGIPLDPAIAFDRAQAVLDASGHSGSIEINGLTVTVTATATVDHSFPAPGFAASVTGSASADLVRSINGTEGG